MFIEKPLVLKSWEKDGILIVKPKIIIEVEAEWEKSTSKYTTCGYRGGWTITKCKGHPEINGGYCSPDFDETPDSIKQRFIDQYSNWYDGKYEIIVKLKITRDDRNPTMESFF